MYWNINGRRSTVYSTLFYSYCITCTLYEQQEITTNRRGSAVQGAQGIGMRDESLTQLAEPEREHMALPFSILHFLHPFF